MSVSLGAGRANPHCHCRDKLQEHVQSSPSAPSPACPWRLPSARKSLCGGPVHHSYLSAGLPCVTKQLKLPANPEHRVKAHG